LAVPVIIRSISLPDARLRMRYTPSPSRTKAQLLLGLVLVLAQADIAAVGGLLHGLNDTAALGSDGIEAICLDHGLRYSFHVNPSKFVSFEPIMVLLLYGAKRGEKFSQTVQNGLKSGGLL